MNRTDRLVAMVMYFQGRRLVRAEELAEHFEISVRTVYRDVAALSEAGVPVTGEAGVGYSLVKGYHLPPVMMTREEATALFVGGEMVKQFTDASLGVPMESALLKLRAVLPREQQDDLDRLRRGMVVTGRPSSKENIDQKTFLPIQQAVIARRVVSMTYQARGRENVTMRSVEPLGIVFYGGAWYLVAWCRLRGNVRHFKLDRVTNLVVTDERFEARPDFSLADHMHENSPPSGGVPVRVWFAPSAVERARRESCTGIVEAVPIRGGVEAHLVAYSLEWFARWLLSFGGEAEALAPDELREKVAEEARRILERYEPPLQDAPDAERPFELIPAALS